MAVTDLSPNVDNYAIYTGIVTWTPLGGSPRDMGNVSELQLVWTVTRLPHFNSRGGLGGVSFQDANPVTRIACVATMKMEEMTAANWQLALLAVRTEGPPIHLEIGAAPNIHGTIQLDGTNSQGARLKLILPDVSMNPSAALNFIDANKWAEITLAVEVYADTLTGSFGGCDWNV
jgi:hypothetical protein